MNAAELKAEIAEDKKALAEMPAEGLAAKPPHDAQIGGLLFAMFPQYVSVTYQKTPKTLAKLAPEKK